MRRFSLPTEHEASWSLVEAFSPPVPGSPSGFLMIENDTTSHQSAVIARSDRVSWRQHIRV
jgi:hypothetical protein